MTKTQYRNAIASNEKKIEKYEKRIGVLKEINKKIAFQFDYDVQDANSYRSSCMFELNQGLKGLDITGTLYDELDIMKEEADTIDSNIASCKTNVDSEITRCNNKITEWENEITSWKNKIAEIERREREEALRKAAEEAARIAAEAQAAMKRVFNI